MAPELVHPGGGGMITDAVWGTTATGGSILVRPANGCPSSSFTTTARAARRNGPDAPAADARLVSSLAVGDFDTTGSRHRRRQPRLQLHVYDVEGQHIRRVRRRFHWARHDRRGAHPETGQTEVPFAEMAPLGPRALQPGTQVPDLRLLRDARWITVRPGRCRGRCTIRPTPLRASFLYNDGKGGFSVSPLP